MNAIARVRIFLCLYVLAAFGLGYAAGSWLR